MNPCQLLIRCVLGIIAIPIGENDALGILIILAVLVLATDGLVMLNSILPIGSPNLKRTNCLAVVPDKIRITV